VKCSFALIRMSTLVAKVIAHIVRKTKLEEEAIPCHCNVFLITKYN
jgi:hypothetical protein